MMKEGLDDGITIMGSAGTSVIQKPFRWERC